MDTITGGTNFMNIDTHTMSHIANVVNSMREENENGLEVTNRILLSEETIFILFYMLSSKFTVEQLKIILSSREFYEQMKILGGN